MWTQPLWHIPITTNTCKPPLPPPPHITNICEHPYDIRVIFIHKYFAVYIFSKHIGLQISFMAMEYNCLNTEIMECCILSSSATCKKQRCKIFLFLFNLLLLHGMQQQWRHYRFCACFWWLYRKIINHSKCTPERNKITIIQKNKSPRGLNAHLNLRKVPVVHLGVCHQLEKLWEPSPGPPWGHVYHLNNSESPTPKDASS